MPRGKKKKSRSERRQEKRAVDPMEEYEMAVLDDLRCPVATARRMSEICEQSIEDALMSFKLLNTGDYVWREEPGRGELHTAMMELRSELERHMEAIVGLYKRIEPLLDEKEEHQDLSPEEVVRRIEPMIAARERDRSADDVAEVE